MSIHRMKMKQAAARPQRLAWIGGFVRGAGPRYLQIADFMEQAVADGSLRPGDRLPPQRQLADALQVDLTTVTRAYAEAKRRNLMEARGAHGSYVAAPKVELAPMIDLSMNIPPPPAGMKLRDLLDQGLSQVLVRTDADQLMTYHLGGGSDADRAAGAMWLEPVLGEVDAARIVVCPGAQSALAALMLSQTRPGDAIVTEPLAYPGVRLAAEQTGRRIISAATDADGLRPDALEQASREQGARLLYLNPTLQNPTARTMPEARRRDLARTAAACGVRIIEDDPYWLLAPRAPVPLADLAPGHTFYVATLSKCLTPGLRTAYVVLPEARERERLLAALRACVLMSAPLCTALATQWIHDGSAARLLAAVQAEARSRLDLALRLLPGAARIPDGGIHVWHALPEHWTSRGLARSARAQGLTVTASDAFCPDLEPPNAIRISLGGVKDRAQLALGLKRLSGLLAREPDAGQPGPIV